MKKFIITALTIFLAVNTNLPASDIFGNDDIWSNRNDKTTEKSSEPVFGESNVFGGRQWLSARPDNWATDENIGDNKEPGVPVGEGLLILMAGGVAYAASKIRRKK